MPHQRPHDETYHREVMIDQRPPKWWDKWINPTTMLAVLGGIVWGIQLNFAVITQTSDIAKLEELSDARQVVNTQQNTQLTRISVILGQVVDKLDGVEDYDDEHEKESHSWKRKIELNTHRLDQIEEKLK